VPEADIWRAQTEVRQSSLPSGERPQDPAKTKELLIPTSVYLASRRLSFLNIRSAKEIPMKNLMCSLIVAVAATFAAAAIAPPDALAANKRSAYAAKKEACKQRASRMNFGIHFVKRDRWIKECIAGAA
jgi:hypothetical protein